MQFKPFERIIDRNIFVYDFTQEKLISFLYVSGPGLYCSSNFWSRAMTKELRIWGLIRYWTSSKCLVVASQRLPFESMGPITRKLFRSFATLGIHITWRVIIILRLLSSSNRIIFFLSFHRCFMVDWCGTRNSCGYGCELLSRLDKGRVISENYIY